MIRTLGPRLGEGGFADVYEAVDDLDRQVAVKIIRPSAAALSSALDHARALARLKHPHPNVVTVYALDTVTDPESGLKVDCVVMEMLEGETLSDRLEGEPISSDAVRAIGLGILQGLAYIHQNGLVHGDLHSENIMVSGTASKIIDILYRSSLALLSTASREAQIRRDVMSAQSVLQDLLQQSELGLSGVNTFHSALSGRPTLDDLESAFLGALDTSPSADVEQQLERALQRVLDAGFVEGDKYAQALANETPPQVTVALLELMVSHPKVGNLHRSYLRCLWDRLKLPQRKEVIVELASAMERVIPKGAWNAPVQSLGSFGRDAWDLLPETCRIRFESALISDVRRGHYDIFGDNSRGPGILGTWASVFWVWFSDVAPLVDNIVERLNSDWYGQNYIAKHFFRVLPLIADSPDRRERLIAAIREAVKNDAKVVIRERDNLPPEWQADINREEPSEADCPLDLDEDLPF